jgi:hypothetical protein
VLRGVLALSGHGQWRDGRGRGCGDAIQLVALEESVENECYMVELTGEGLSCFQDDSMACCRDLPTGHEVMVVGKYDNRGGDGPFAAELYDVQFCTQPGETFPRPVR